MNPPFLRGIRSAAVICLPFWLAVYFLRAPLADFLTVAAHLAPYWVAAFVVLAVVAWAERGAS